MRAHLVAKMNGCACLEHRLSETHVGGNELEERQETPQMRGREGRVHHLPMSSMGICILVLELGQHSSPEFELTWGPSK